jgi:hypothetical protein
MLQTALHALDVVDCTIVDDMLMSCGDANVTVTTAKGSRRSARARNGASEAPGQTALT